MLRYNICLLGAYTSAFLDKSSLSGFNPDTQNSSNNPNVLNPLKRCLCLFCNHRLSTVHMAVADPSSTSSDISPDVEQCECPWGYSGTSCEVQAHTDMTWDFIPQLWQIGTNFFLLEIFKRDSFAPLFFLFLCISFSSCSLCSLDLYFWVLSSRRHPVWRELSAVWM